MLEKKNIDTVFQENLKDLDIFPSERVWNNIEIHLTQNPKKRTFALWQRLGGIAMLFLLFFSSGVWYYSSNSTIPNTNSLENNIIITDVDNTNNINSFDQQPIANSQESIVQTNSTQKSVIPAIKREKTAFVKKPNNNVIITSTDITTIYESIDNKYVVNKSDFLQSLKSNESLISNINPVNIEENNPTLNKKKWSVGPTVAPVYYNSLQSGSPIDQNLANNSKASENALSVGVKLNYQLTDKIKIQSGINKVELSYLTKNVNATASASKQTGSSINSGIVLSNSGGQANSLIDSKSKSGLNGDLSQSIEYFELPIEMKYSLYERRFGIDLVGGFSTFVLTNNSVSIVSQNQNIDLGEVNNLNTFNFSGNVGIDFDYKINKNWFLNVAPMFKYQFNTYSNNSGDFQPYYFGVYSGLNYRF